MLGDLNESKNDAEEAGGKVATLVDVESAGTCGDDSFNSHKQNVPLKGIDACR